RRTALAFIVLVTVMIMLGVLGFFLLILWFVFVLTRRIRLRLSVQPLFGSIYAETFALWMVLFVGIGYGLSWIPAGSSQLLLSEIGAFLSLSALAWPRIRGVPAQRLRDDIGLSTSSLIRDLFAGIACYAAALPMLLAGVLVTLALTWVRKQFVGPAE